MATTKKPGDSASKKKPGTGTSARPGAGAPTRPGTGQPTKPGTGQPAKPGTGQPTKPGTGQPTSPKKPAATTAPKPFMSADRAESAASRKATSTTSPVIPDDTGIPQTTIETPTTTGGVSVVQNQSTTVQDQEFANWEEAAKELYGGYYSIIQSVPELQDLLRKAYGPPMWSDAKFKYELEQTSWWKQNSSTARQWDLQSQTDPASAEQQINARIAEMQSLALSEYQADLSDSQLRKLATDSLRGGWTRQMVMNAIGIEAVRGQGLSQIATGFLGQGIRATANEYGVVLSDDAFNKWVSDIATGKESKETFQQYAVTTAKTLFPAIAQQLDAGMTFQQVIDPYKNVASQILELNPNQINFLDPKWAKAVSLVDGNQQRMMNFNEWGDYLRQERSFGYEYTSEAQSRAYEVANNLANMFGKA